MHLASAAADVDLTARLTIKLGTARDTMTWEFCRYHLIRLAVGLAPIAAASPFIHIVQRKDSGSDGGLFLIDLVLVCALLLPGIWVSARGVGLDDATPNDRRHPGGGGEMIASDGSRWTIRPELYVRPEIIEKTGALGVAERSLKGKL